MGQNKALIITSSRFVQVTLATLHKLRSMLVRMQSCFSVDHGMIYSSENFRGYRVWKDEDNNIFITLSSANGNGNCTENVMMKAFAPRGQCFRRTTKRIYYLKSRIPFIAMEGCMDLALYSRT